VAADGAGPRLDLAGLSVRRPILVLVLNLLICIAGIAALLGVEVRELPDVDRPIVAVRASYPGASPAVVDTEVTRILEGAAARVTGVRNIRAASEETYARVIVEFDPSVALNDAANDLREAVARVERQLPDLVEDVTVIKADDNADPVVQLAVSSDRYAMDRLTRIVEDEIVPALTAVPGVAEVPVFGAARRILRVVLDPLRLAAHGLAISDVAAALRNARFDVPAGSFDSGDQNLVVRADASLVRAEQVAGLAIRGTTRIGDVADVFFAPDEVESYARYGQRLVIGVGVVRQAQSNTIDIADGVDRAVAELARTLPDVSIVKTADDAVFIRGAIREVLLGLTLAVAIVVAVIYVFLGSLRATLIPTVAIPVALIGTVAAIWLLGFSINILTLLALVLATGLVVDDAIVVLENVERRRAMGLARRAAAVLGTRQVFFAVIATTATLASVFVPISFLPGSAGRLFAEFGVVLAIAVCISSFVALSLCPMLAARLPEGTGAAPGRLARGLAAAGGRLGGGYAWLLDRALRRPLLVLAGCGLAILAAWFAYAAIDEELLPNEDRGTLQISMRGPDGVGLAYMDRQVETVEGILAPYLESGEVTGTYTIVGRWDLNAAYILAPLVPWEARSRPQAEIVSELRRPLEAVPGIRVNMLTPNSLGIRGGGVGLSFALTGIDYERLAEYGDRMLQEIERRELPLVGARMDFATTQPQLSVNVDRERANDLGIDIEAVAATLRAMVNGDEVAELNVDDRAVPIILGSSLGTVNDPEDLRNLFVATADGRSVPLSSFITLDEQGISPELDRVQQRRAVELQGSLATGYALRQAVSDVQAIAAEVLPPDIRMVLQGEAATLDETSSGVLVTFAIALVVVLLVLAAQFESFTSAAVVMVTVPFGIAAALLALWLSGVSLNIYSQIGLVMLIGLMAKNGILVVEFADQLRDAGAGVGEAAREAAVVRLRPVMMTMISTVLAALPLVLGSGPGAEARAAIGWVVFGGLGFATVFTLFLTPVGYVLLARWSRPRAAAQQRLEAELAEAERAEAPETLRKAAE